VVAGVLLLGTGFICELVARKVKNQSSNPSLWSYSGCASLIWIELAVGIFGTPLARKPQTVIAFITNSTTKKPQQNPILLWFFSMFNFKFPSGVRGFLPGNRL
jgi:hypothetical protein